MRLIRRAQTFDRDDFPAGYRRKRLPTGFFRVAVEQTTVGHIRLFLSAADTYSEEATAKLVREAYPQTELRRPFVGTECVFDLTAARDVLGFAPHHSWRDYRAGGFEGAPT